MTNLIRVAAAAAAVLMAVDLSADPRVDQQVVDIDLAELRAGAWLKKCPAGAGGPCGPGCNSGTCGWKFANNQWNCTTVQAGAAGVANPFGLIKTCVGGTIYNFCNNNKAPCGTFQAPGGCGNVNGVCTNFGCIVLGPGPAGC